MEAFSYKAVVENGSEKRGTIEAESKADAARKLKDSGLMPLEITAQTMWDKELNIPVFKKKVSTRDLSVFCRQFSSILKAGVSVINALEMLAEQTENKQLQAAIKDVQSNVEKGENLSNSMRQHVNIFTPLLVSMIAAGESSGSLETAIERMAIQFEKDAKLKGLVKKAMMYPIVLCFVAVGVVAVMLIYVIPSFMSMFDDLGTQLPLATRIVIGMSDFLQNEWYILLAVIAAVVFGWKTWAKTESGRYKIDQFKLKLPVFGKLIQKTACARFARTLSTLLQAGMPMMNAIETTADTMSNVLFKNALLKTKSGVGLGLAMSGQLRATGIFPSMVVHMASIGEETGNMEEMLLNVANYYDEEVEITTQQATALMEPLIILVMALVVGGIIMSIYGPMITLYNTLG